MRLASLVMVLVFLSAVAQPATLEGVSLPETETEDGAALVLNGIGLRTASIFHVKIYVAGLYLEQRSPDGEAIIRSPGRKLLVIRFLRDISAADGRTAWTEGFEGNCHPPCQLQHSHVDRFLAAVPPVRAGDVARLMFSGGHLQVTINGQPVGMVDDHAFARVILATFIGRVPPTEELKRGLLGRASR